ncbi:MULTISPECIES: hypothetical protein [unclassified Streptomyces]|uniref:hypothetical protein n=1 Tax=unclassified Streptomyces TaxID=2593676 RepID=UPI002E0D699C|nr:MULTISPECIES: hypothetical protein [unclassified Streptomyces]WSJ38678.1 hypothetical protein OG772_23500 [Streptomyces sp. NBC_01321]WSP64969.1 hypothetical protein OG466_26120 [Streptomyces sp. NBC_01240]
MRGTQLLGVREARDEVVGEVRERAAFQDAGERDLAASACACVAVHANGQHRVPATVLGAAANGRTRSVAVSASVDGGTSWTRVPVERGAVTIHNPRAGTGVSLRTALTDAEGNTLTRTVIDAYRTQ